MLNSAELTVIHFVCVNNADIILLFLFTVQFVSSFSLILCKIAIPTLSDKSKYDKTFIPFATVLLHFYVFEDEIIKSLSMPISTFFNLYCKY